jgi:hypothetical protein
MDKYIGKDNYGNPKSEYLKKIVNYDFEHLFAETKDRIWLSAYANNNPRSDYHWQCDACYDEWVMREGTGAKSYDKAYKEVVAENE